MDGDAPRLTVQLTVHGKRLEARMTAQQGEARGMSPTHAPGVSS